VAFVGKVGAGPLRASDPLGSARGVPAEVLRGLRRSGKHVAEPPELFRFKCASHRHTADNDSTHFKRNNPLVCWVSALYNHGSIGSR
jgi:hypothetical protein